MDHRGALIGWLASISMRTNNPIIVRAATYFENLALNKSLTLTAESHNTAISDAGTSNLNPALDAGGSPYLQRMVPSHELAQITTF
jgi:hypothetical protein